LHAAAVEADLQLLAKRLSEQDPDVRDYLQRTPLMLAASTPHRVEAVALLMKAGASTKAKDGHGRTPLHYAAEYGAKEDVFLLLTARGVPVDISDDASVTPLMLAAGSGKASAVQILLALDARADRVDITGKTPLSHAYAGSRDADTIAILTRAKTAPAAGAKYPFDAPERNLPRHVLDFAASGAGKVCGCGRARADCACAARKGYIKGEVEAVPFGKGGGDLGVIRGAFYFRDGVCREARAGKLGRNAFEEAALGDAEALRRRAKSGESLTISDANGVTPLMVAASAAVSEERSVETVWALLSLGAHVDRGANNGRTALMEAISRARAGVAGALIDAGADVARTDDMGRSALHYAALAGDAPVLELVLSALPKAGGPGHFAPARAPTHLWTRRDVSGATPLALARGPAKEALERHVRAAKTWRPAGVAPLTNAPLGCAPAEWDKALRGLWQRCDSDPRMTLRNAVALVRSVFARLCRANDVGDAGADPSIEESLRALGLALPRGLAAKTVEFLARAEPALASADAAEVDSRGSARAYLSTMDRPLAEEACKLASAVVEAVQR